jgi:hypothetical protein
MGENLNSKQSIGYKIADIITSVLTTQNIQTYILGTKKSGKPRAIYDIVREETSNKKKKKKKIDDVYSLYHGVKKKKKKKNKKSKYWKFDDMI